MLILYQSTKTLSIIQCNANPQQICQSISNPPTIAFKIQPCHLCLPIHVSYSAELDWRTSSHTYLKEGALHGANYSQDVIIFKPQTGVYPRRLWSIKYQFSTHPPIHDQSSPIYSQSIRTLWSELMELVLWRPTEVSPRRTNRTALGLSNRSQQRNDSPNRSQSSASTMPIRCKSDQHTANPGL